MRRTRSLLAPLVAAIVLLTVGVAGAALRKPKLGAWVTSGGGFTLQNGTGKNKGKVVLTNFHLLANNGGCPEPFVSATVVGKFPLKVFTRRGASTWGVGRNVGGEPEPMAAKVVAAGTSYTGSFSVIFYYQHPSTQVLSGTLSFGGCNVYMSYAKPKN